MEKNETIETVELREVEDTGRKTGSGDTILKVILLDGRSGSAFDERFFCYADDDAMCLQMRRAGWKIMLEPRASGVQLEGQSNW